MFPHTPHIESVSLLRRAHGSAEEHDAGVTGGMSRPAHNDER